MITSKIKKITRGKRRTKVYIVSNVKDNHNYMVNSVINLNCDEAVRFACITGDSLIKTPTGLKFIKNLENQKNFEVYSYNKQSKKEEIQIAEKCIEAKKDIVYEIELENGQTIQTTKEHKFLTINGWKKLEELKNGNSIITI